MKIVLRSFSFSSISLRDFSSSLSGIPGLETADAFADSFDTLLGISTDSSICGSMFLFGSTESSSHEVGVTLEEDPIKFFRTFLAISTSSSKLTSTGLSSFSLALE